MCLHAATWNLLDVWQVQTPLQANSYQVPGTQQGFLTWMLPPCPGQKCFWWERISEVEVPLVGCATGLGAGCPHPCPSLLSSRSQHSLHGHALVAITSSLREAHADILCPKKQVRWVCRRRNRGFLTHPQFDNPPQSVWFDACPRPSAASGGLLQCTQWVFGAGGGQAGGSPLQKASQTLVLSSLDLFLTP